MAAANSWKSGGGGLRLVTVGKRLIANRLICNPSIPTPTPTPSALLRMIPSSSSSLSYTASTSSNNPLPEAYEKNPDDQAPQPVVLDELIQPESEEYWAPNPQTGVFGPTSDHSSNPTEHGEGGAHSSPEGSVLEEEAFFRLTSIEDLEKPVSLPETEAEE
ncbi:hypothetical protein CDL15_Pgr021904 [Punica granatum]|uniref:Late embryogenesis abundant protein At5g17165-like n=1 Tax=Punica granatum TaxID=22663 RepID=A0A218WTA3_PUNGR|nr:hypothetical protein CDL15_Pgr021904 [Punica granatum]PKI54577.1 hypothetical protein CRG98_025091 [Punica granatum]